MGIFDRLKNLFKADKENKEQYLEKQLEVQAFVNQLTFKLADFWGISRNDFIGKMPKIFVYKPGDEDLKKWWKRGYGQQLALGKTFYVDKYKTIFFPEFSLAGDSGFEGWKALLAEEVGHFINHWAKENISIKDNEFFAGISSLFFAEIIPGSFKNEYGNLLKGSRILPSGLKEDIEKEKEIEKGIKLIQESEKDPILLKEKLEELNREREKLLNPKGEYLQHIYQEANTALYFEIRKMTPAQRYKFLKLDHSELVNKFLFRGALKIGEIGTKIQEREASKEKLKEIMEKYPESSSFFQKVAEEHGKEEYGRGTRNLDEVAMELSDIKSEEDALQGLVEKLSFQLADWWGIPRTKISFFIPKVRIFSKEEMENEGKVVATAFQKTTLNNFMTSYRIVINKDWYSNEFFAGHLTSVKSAMAEEVCHFLEEEVKTVMGIPENEYVSEFFGLVSRFFIAEQNKGLFKEEYRNCLKIAVDFNEKYSEYMNLLIENNNLEQSLRNVPLETPRLKELEAESERIKAEIQGHLNHLSYYPASAYYFEIKKLSPIERFALLTKAPNEIVNAIIGRQEEKLIEIKNKMQQRAVGSERFENRYPTLLYGSYSKALSELPEGSPETEAMKVVKAGFIREANKRLGNVGQFFQKIAEGVGKKEYGRVAEAVTAKLEQHEQEPAIETGEVMEEYTQEEQEPEQPVEEPAEEEYPEAEQNLEEQTQGEYEQPEEVQEEQYGPESEQAPQQPKISISIPKKVPKNVAKKLESMGVKLPKKMIKN
jgi:hypothetical protein